MANFLLPVSSGLTDRLIHLIDSLPENRKSFNPFKDKEFSRIFISIVRKNKSSIPNYYKKLMELKQNFKIFLWKNVKRKYWAAETDNSGIWLFSGYFSDTKTYRRIYLEHELTHVIQFLFERKRPKKSRKIVAEFAEPTKEYYNDFYELETTAKDLYYIILNKKKRGKFKTQADVVNFIKKGKDYKLMNHKNRKKTLRKIMINLWRIS